MTKKDINIRKATIEDWDSLWQIISLVIKEGDTYVFAPTSSKETMKNYWLAESNHVFVAETEGAICGTYLLKDNQPGLGSHIANGSYMVHPKFQGRGIGKVMGKHSLETAKHLNYKAMQFNIVVKGNQPAIHLWERLGFHIIGEIPEAFQHTQLGLINAYIMHRKL
ncbi:MAG: GNAT family N-acetyltransferase [Cyclobacteriaceae bacterium]